MFVKKKPRGKSNLSARLEAVSNPGFGNDVARRRCFRLQLLTQLAHKYPQIFNLFRTLPAPDRAEQCPVSYHFSRMPREINQKIEFLRRQPYFAITQRDFMRRQIDAEITHFNQRRLITLRRKPA